LIRLVLVSDGTYETSGAAQSSSVKVPYLYPSGAGRTNLALVAGISGTLGFTKAVILDKNGNKYEYIPSIYNTSALSFTRSADVQTIKTKLVNAAHASGLYPPYTSVLHPNGGETLTRNSTINLTWATANLGGNVKIELYKGVALNATITASVTNNGTYAWSIPAAQPEGTDYKIRVTPLSATNKFDNSNTNFTIRNAKTTVTYPNGGQTFNVYNSPTITWTPDGVAGYVRIDLYKGGVSNATITASTTNSGSYAWAIPDAQPVGSNYQVRVALVNDALSADLSDSNFVVRTPKTTVTYPNGGQTFNIYNSPTVTWTPDGVPGYVRIDLYKGGVSNSTITASTTNNGAYVWAIPDALTVGNDYKVSVTPVNEPLAMDLSDTNFTIRTAKTTVTYPNGGEKFSINDTLDIKWAPDAVTGNVNIELYRLGSLYSTIATNTANDGSNTWVIPANQNFDTNYAVRVLPLNDPAAADDGDATFAVLPLSLTFYTENMNTNPGWTYGTSWAYGVTTVSSSNLASSGRPDPTNGYTGANLIGYRLDGAYEHNIATTRYVVTKAIDCRGYSGVKLQFMRWLGVETPLYDRASIDVSKNGTNWVSVWTNSATVSDASWTLCKYDIAATADGQSTVYIRWGMGKTDSADNYCGWNIDDVQLLGVPPYTTNWTPYSWLASIGITNNQEAAVLQDIDGDGALNWEEYLAGTSPTNPNSVFSILSSTSMSTSNAISWYATTNSGVTSSIIIHRATNLTSGIWQPVGTNSRSPSGTNVWWDVNPPANVPLFYRLSIP